MNTHISKDIKKHMARIDKKHEQHPIVGLLVDLGVSPKTMVEIFKEEKEISRGTVYNVFSGYVKNIPRKVENKLLITLKAATEEAIMVANLEKNQTQV